MREGFTQAHNNTATLPKARQTYIVPECHECQHPSWVCFLHNCPTKFPNSQCSLQLSNKLYNFYYQKSWQRCEAEWCLNFEVANQPTYDSYSCLQHPTNNLFTVRPKIFLVVSVIWSIVGLQLQYTFKKLLEYSRNACTERFWFDALLGSC